ncbi:AAA family ATPase, partial [Allosphingosinicella sp.]|uniref:AAA family ATPase n=1 Tax=Allosphingosinicella sp. TaxID=2823234 RepID=UPI002EE34366
EEIRHAFEGTVVDLPRPMLVQFPHLLNEAHAVVLVVEFTLAATRDTIRVLSWLKANAPQCRVILVANKTQPSGLLEVSRKDFEQSIERKVDIVIPFDPKSAAQAAKLGQPFAKVAKGSKLTQPLTQLLALAVATAEPGAEAEAAAAEGGGSLLGSLKALLAKKPDTKKAA